jgi:hypothetical protein
VELGRVARLEHQMGITLGVRFLPH